MRLFGALGFADWSQTGKRGFSSRNRLRSGRSSVSPGAVELWPCWLSREPGLHSVDRKY